MPPHRGTMGARHEPGPMVMKAAASRREAGFVCCASRRPVCGPLRAASTEALHLPCLLTKGERLVQAQACSSLPSASHRDYSKLLSKQPCSRAFTTSDSHDCGFEIEQQQCGCVGEGDAWAVMPSVQDSTGSALSREGLRGCPRRLPFSPLYISCRALGHTDAPGLAPACLHIILVSPAFPGPSPGPAWLTYRPARWPDRHWRRLRGRSGRGWWICTQPGFP